MKKLPSLEGGRSEQSERREVLLWGSLFIQKESFFRTPFLPLYKGDFYCYTSCSSLWVRMLFLPREDFFYSALKKYFFYSSSFINSSIWAKMVSMLCIPSIFTNNQSESTYSSAGMVSFWYSAILLAIAFWSASSVRI